MQKAKDKIRVSRQPAILGLLELSEVDLVLRGAVSLPAPSFFWRARRGLKMHS